MYRSASVGDIVQVIATRKKGVFTLVVLIIKGDQTGLFRKLERVLFHTGRSENPTVQGRRVIQKYIWGVKYKIIRKSLNNIYFLEKKYIF